jgi:two-component system nitrogen regulation response regulator NtrX
LTPGEFIDVHDLRFAGLGSDTSVDATAISSFRDARAVFEKEFLISKIQENGGNISKTAEVIGLERSYLHRKIRSYGIDSHRSQEEEEKEMQSQVSGSKK